MKAVQPPSLGFPLGESWLGVVALCLLIQLASTLSTVTTLQPGEFAGLLKDLFVPFFGVFISVATVISASRYLPDRGPARWLSLGGVVLVAALLGACTSGGVEIALDPQGDSEAWAGRVYAKVTMPALVAALSEFQRLREATRSAMEDERLRAVALQGQIVEARLQLLQAQIEPHFLFNSLANLRRLSRLDGPAGARLLADLLRYLEAALPQMRSEACTVSKEIELARAFLAIHQVRMGPRLNFTFDLPPDLADTHLPPMMLLTLLENALKHGIGPLPEGGQIVIRVARADEGRVSLTVADNGQGLRPALGHGIGLTNVRSRLRSLYGDAGSLTLSLNEPRGVVVSIVWPERHA
jgi:signal transduction histidine kinase